MEDLSISINQYENQLLMVKQALERAQDDKERESLLALQSELEELITLTKESLDVQKPNNSNLQSQSQTNYNETNELDDEYALFMREMADSGALNKDGDNNMDDTQDGSDIEDELASLLGMKCAVYHTHAWGGQPSLHNAMVSSVEPRLDEDQFNDLQVRVLYTHPTHAEMLPCPYFLNGDCKFNDEQCRYSHGAVIKLSDLKEAIEPNYDGIKIGSCILLKLNPPDDEDMTVAKKTTEKYHLWHRAIVKALDLEKRQCIVKLEQKVGEKRKSSSEEYHVKFEEIFPLISDGNDSEESDDSLSDTEYPDSKCARSGRDLGVSSGEGARLLADRAPGDVAMGEWERHTRGMGSKIMLAMGYVPGTGLGAASDGRLQPVQARVLPRGATLDQALAAGPLQVEQKLKKIQKKEEERSKRVYEREKERERRNVFNFINRTLGDQSGEPPPAERDMDVKQSTSKDLNIEQFKITEECKRLELEVVKLQTSLVRYPPETSGYRSVKAQIADRIKELNALKLKEQKISREQKLRKDKQKMTAF